MTIDMKEMKKRLLQRKREITRSRGDLTEVQPKVVNSDEIDDDTKDSGDYAVDVIEQQQEVAISANDRALLGEINDALQRIKDGTYGKCVVDGKPIPESRLKAVPWVARCVQHEEELERQNAAAEEADSHNRDTRYA